MKSKYFSIFDDDDLYVSDDWLHLEFKSLYCFDKRFKPNDTLICKNDVLDFFRHFKELYKSARINQNLYVEDHIPDLSIRMKYCTSNKLLSIHLTHYTVSEYSGDNQYFFYKQINLKYRASQKCLSQIDKAIIYIRDEKMKEIEEKYNPILNIKIDEK